MRNLLMIQDETTSPGYCLLQELRNDLPLPLTGYIPNRHTVRDKEGKVLCKNTYFNDFIEPGLIIHGPAYSFTAQSDRIPDSDHVVAFQCASWPVEAQPWLERQGIGRWPTEEMKRYSMKTGCFLVPVSSKSGQNTETEWRISTSMAERILMFSLNMTQIRCYVLMKMILKTFINPQCNDVISSYMCKTVLFHCIQNNNLHEWQENNLLPCLTHCLLKLHHFIREENCPHFIILENNLLAGKLSDPIKHQLLEIVQHIIQSEGSILLEISFDDFGKRLNEKLNINPTSSYQTFTLNADLIIVAQMLDTSLRLSYLYHDHLKQAMCASHDTARLGLTGFIIKLTTANVSCTSMLKKSICELLFPLVCSSLGSVIASSDIHMYNTVSPQALEWLSAGLNSDVSSGRLKLASALYCGGETERAELILRNIEDQYDQNTVQVVCGCYKPGMSILRVGFILKCYTGNEEMIKYIVAFCVMFMRCEINSVPKELQYEMFRSTEYDRHHRDKGSYWMDWAVVDSLPYLYFLQYKIYGHLQRPAGQQCALTYLATTIDTEPNLRHRETALNLLGQCMEQENRYNDALRYYVRSLNIRPRNNAAKIHICRLLNTLVNRHDTEQ